MSLELTQSHFEDAVAQTNAFLHTERGAAVDGDFASRQIEQRIVTKSQAAEDVLTSARVRLPNAGDVHLAVGRLTVGDQTHVGARFDEAVAALPGYFVLLPGNTSRGVDLFPAVVSEDGLKTDSLRLHVLAQPYRSQVGAGASVVLSAAGQAETTGIGDHGRTSNDGVEAEHFATLLAAGSDPSVRAAWQSGQHVNHDWRQQAGNSVTTQVSKRLFGNDIPQSTLTITRQQVESGKVQLFWHEGMRDPQTGTPETATKANALVIIQSLGFEALKERSPANIDTVKRMIA